MSITDSATLDSLLAPRSGTAEVVDSPQPVDASAVGDSAEAGQSDVGIPNPSIGPHPPGPIIAQRGLVELAASQQGNEMVMEEREQRDRPVLDPSGRPIKQSRLSAPEQNVMRVELQHQDDWFSRMMK